MSMTKSCPECGSHNLAWSFTVINKSRVQNGLLRMHDVDGLVYLGCEECSETVDKISPDCVVKWLNGGISDVNNQK